MNELIFMHLFSSSNTMQNRNISSMEYNHPPVVDGESVQKQTNAVWEKRPTLVPITVILRESLPKREIQVCLYI